MQATSSLPRSARRRGALAGACRLGVIVGAALVLGGQAALRCRDLLWLGMQPQGPTRAARILRRAAESEAAIKAETEKDEQAEKEAKRSSELIESVTGLVKDIGPIGGSSGGGLVWINRPGKESFEVYWEAADTVMDLHELVSKESKIPMPHLELRCLGDPMGRNDTLLDDWVRDSGGVAASMSGLAPDVWAFDARLEDDRDAASPAIRGPEPETEDGNRFRQNVYIVATVLGVFWVTQVLGINPFTDSGSIVGGDKAPKPAEEVVERLLDKPNPYTGEIARNSYQSKLNAKVTEEAQKMKEEEERNLAALKAEQAQAEQAAIEKRLQERR